MSESTQLFSQATTLLVVGMGFVFVFLGLLIVVIKVLISPLAKKYPDKVIELKKPENTSGQDQSSLVAAITVAVNNYRQKHL